ncbi:hypothetical protein [Lysobacter gummosus]|uniref:hypothetical protein n=1 Tax=Lysobacter gummosus TaxID=262324 RepID=UPI00363FAD3E
MRIKALTVKHRCHGGLRANEMRPHDGSITAVHNRIWLQAASCFALMRLCGLSSGFPRRAHRYDAPYGEAVPMSSAAPAPGSSAPERMPPPPSRPSCAASNGAARYWPNCRPAMPPPAMPRWPRR